MQTFFQPVNESHQLKQLFMHEAEKIKGYFEKYLIMEYFNYFPAFYELEENKEKVELYSALYARFINPGCYLYLMKSLPENLDYNDSYIFVDNEILYFVDYHEASEILRVTDTPNEAKKLDNANEFLMLLQKINKNNLQVGEILLTSEEVLQIRVLNKNHSSIGIGKNDEIININRELKNSVDLAYNLFKDNPNAETRENLFAIFSNIFHDQEKTFMRGHFLALQQFLKENKEQLISNKEIDPFADNNNEIVPAATTKSSCCCRLF